MVIVGILFLGALLASGVFYIAQASLEYENIKEEIGSVVEGLIEQEGILGEVRSNYAEINMSCIDKTEVSVDINLTSELLVVPCDVVAKGFEELVSYSIDSTVESVYYHSYDCEFWDCFGKTESPFFLISQHARNYWKSKLYLSLVALLVLLGAMFFLVENKANSLIIAGGLLLVSSFAFLKVDSLIGFFVEKEIFEIFSSLFSAGSSGLFSLALILGIIFLGTGISMRIWHFGFTKKKFSERDVKKIVKEEVAKKK